jgi:hypothetical protein
MGCEICPVLHIRIEKKALPVNALGSRKPSLTSILMMVLIVWTG